MEFPPYENKFPEELKEFTEKIIYMPCLAIVYLLASAIAFGLQRYGFQLPFFWSCLFALGIYCSGGIIIGFAFGVILWKVPGAEKAANAFAKMTHPWDLFFVLPGMISFSSLIPTVVFCYFEIGVYRQVYLLSTAVSLLVVWRYTTRVSDVLEWSWATFLPRVAIEVLVCAYLQPDADFLEVRSWILWSFASHVSFLMDLLESIDASIQSFSVFGIRGLWRPLYFFYAFYPMIYPILYCGLGCVPLFFRAWGRCPCELHRSRAVRVEKEPTVR